MFAPVLNRRGSEEACLREATELLMIADMAMVERDYASAGALLEAAYQAFDDAAVRTQSNPIINQMPVPAGGYATSH